ncbi:hypothetical protein AS850_08820 [Frondihabitans sp. 762G35]|nr:hypothetical protein AS850_08820 [Frondihabitans sp. 762G35]
MAVAALVAAALGLLRPGVAVGAAAGAVLVAAAWSESLIRSRVARRADERRFESESDSFAVDLRRLLDRERAELVRSSSSGPPPGDDSGPFLELGRGSVVSAIEVVPPGPSATQEPRADADRRPVVDRAPLLVPASGGVLVSAPPRLARRLARGLAADLARRVPGAVLIEHETADGTLALVVRVPWRGRPIDCRLVAGGPVEGSGGAGRGPAAQLWIGPDGSALARSVGQARGGWVAVEPRIHAEAYSVPVAVPASRADPGAQERR